MPDAQYRQPISKRMKTNVETILTFPPEEESPLESGFSSSIYTVLADVPEAPEKEEEESSSESEALEITQKPKTGVYDVELLFHGAERATGGQDPFSLTIRHFSKLVVQQDFINNVCDYISAAVTLTPQEMVQLMDNYRELRCHVYIRMMSEEDETIDRDHPVLDRDYLVILKDKEIRKRLNKQALIPNDYLDKTPEHSHQTFDVEFQLITETEYKLRFERFHFILTQATIKDVILYAAQLMGIKQVSLPDPDNKTKYENMIIPPQQSFQSFIAFLQDRYGVYEYGCNYYYTGDVLYIYPLYKRTVSDCPEVTNFYCTGDGSYPGAKFYHAKDQNNSYHIVINRTPHVKELIDSGAENFGNVITFEYLERVIDNAAYVLDGEGKVKARAGLGKINVNESNTGVFTWESPNTTRYGITNDPYWHEFRATTNRLKYKSDLMSYRGVLVSFQWHTAELYILRPGFAVKWHIDGERDNPEEQDGEEPMDPDAPIRNTMEYKTYDGITASVSYTFVPASNMLAKKFPITCVADVVLNLDYRQTDQQEANMNYESSDEQERTSSGGGSGGGSVAKSNSSGTSLFGIPDSPT